HDGRQYTPVDRTAYTNRPSAPRSCPRTAFQRAESLSFSIDCTADIAFIMRQLSRQANDPRYPKLASKLGRDPPDPLDLPDSKMSWCRLFASPSSAPAASADTSPPVSPPPAQTGS